MSRRARSLARLRGIVGQAALGVAEAATGKRVLSLDYPPRHLGPRYGYGRPPHARLLEILSRDDEAYRRNLETLVGYREDLLAIGQGRGGGADPPWISNWLLGMDVVSLYGFLRAREPRSYVEVGSGTSTMWARRAIRDGGLSTRITSIDPEPRREVEALCDRSVRDPLEAADLAVFEDLAPGDVLFMDGSHRVLENSDATVFFLDVLPSLPAGILVGVHDILLPDDYLPMWTEYCWSEQYLMAAHLLAEGATTQLELACSYVTEHSDLHRILDPLWEALSIDRLDRRGFALWFTTTGREPDRPDH